MLRRDVEVDIDYLHFKFQNTMLKIDFIKQILALYNPKIAGILVYYNSCVITLLNLRNSTFCSKIWRFHVGLSGPGLLKCQE